MVPAYLMGSDFLEVVGELGGKAGGKGYQTLPSVTIDTIVHFHQCFCKSKLSDHSRKEAKLSNNLKRHNLLQSFMN